MEKPQRPRAVKTTVVLPEDLWRAAKIRAMDEREDLRTVLIKALERYLGPSAPTAPTGAPAGGAASGADAGGIRGRRR